MKYIITPLLLMCAFVAACIAWWICLIWHFSFKEAGRGFNEVLDMLWEK
jgi:hypothetical protein